jgi:hypothetical protein
MADSLAQPASEALSPAELAAQLAARICHDLINPASALPPASICWKDPSARTCAKTR